LIDLSLDAIARDQTLYERFCDGDNMLFQRSDFENPGTSAVFRELRQIRPLADKLDAFASICKRPIEQVPTLEEFLAKLVRPRPLVRRPASHHVPAQPKPEGMSNLDYIKSTLGKSNSGPTPSTVQMAAPDGAAARSGTPLSDWIASWTSTLPQDPDNRLSWWLGVIIVALVLLVFLVRL